MRELSYRPGMKKRKRFLRSSYETRPRQPWERVLLSVFSALFLAGLIWLCVLLVSTQSASQMYQDTAKKYAGTGQVDFEQLWQENRDIVAWIRIPGTPVNYPVLQGDNDQQYLRTTYQGHHNVLGSIFLSEDNRSDFSDPNSVIFGHNSHGKTMFGTLKNFRSSDYWREHPEIYLSLPGETRVYRILSVRETRTGSDVYQISFADTEDQISWKWDQKSASVISTDPVEPNDSNTITLSTCAGSNTNRRIVLVAQRVR